MAYHFGMMFSTYDHDNDPWAQINCAVEYRGAWWYDIGHHSNLNGEYNNTGFAQGVGWAIWTGHYYSLMFSKMKIRAANY